MARGGDQVIPRPDGWRPGNAAPWAHLDDPAAAFEPDRVRRLVGRRGVGAEAAAESWGARPAAVLIPLYVADDQMRVVTTRRAWHLRSHHGEVSFPGGGADPGDGGPADTALREAREEIDLDPGTVEIVGELDHLTTVSSDRFIVPVVGLLAAAPTLVASPDEVDAIVDVGFRDLLDPAAFREERWRWPAGTEFPVTFFEVEGDTIWGATAAILRQFMTLMLGIDEPQFHP